MGVFVARTTAQKQFRFSRPAEARATTLRADPLYNLFLLNIVLQLFDGVATYSGLHLGVGEANQLLCNAFALWGVGPSLILFKTLACATLVLLYRSAPEELSRRALTFLAGIYCAFSLIPWIAKLVTLALPVL